MNRLTKYKVAHTDGILFSTKTYEAHGWKIGGHGELILHLWIQKDGKIDDLDRVDSTYVITFAPRAWFFISSVEDGA